MSEVTMLLDQWHRGDAEARDALFAIVYNELKVMASARMASEGGYHTLQPTALIHECFFKLVAQNEAGLRNRGQFFALAARMMRRVLLDHARAKQAQKRPVAGRDLNGDVEALGRSEMSLDPVVLDDALHHLASVNPELCLLVELKHFGGFGMDEIATFLQRPPSTVYRMWKTAKAHLFQYYRRTQHA